MCEMYLSRDELITVIETHTKNVRFCILCNYVNKITPAIQSRCTRFRFSPLPEREVQKKVDQVIEQEGWVLSFFFHSHHSLYPPSPYSTSSPRIFVFEIGKEEERDGIADNRCNITDDGKAALLRLSKGDMRRALNVLQVSTLLSFSRPDLSPLPLYHDCHHSEPLMYLNQISRPLTLLRRVHWS
jgi:replication factor C subunit 3/5